MKLCVTLIENWLRSREDPLAMDPKHVVELGVFLDQQLDKVRNIKQTLKKYQADLVNLEKLHKEERRKIMEEIKVVQNGCPHLARTYYPDPSGNNDSYTECDHCGATV